MYRQDKYVSACANDLNYFIQLIAANFDRQFDRQFQFIITSRNKFANKTCCLYLAVLSQLICPVVYDAFSVYFIIAIIINITAISSRAKHCIVPKKRTQPATLNDTQCDGAN